VASLLVNALLMSAVMTEEMERSAEKVVRTNQLHAVQGGESGGAAVASSHVVVTGPRAASPPSAVARDRDDPRTVRIGAKIVDSAPAVQHKQRSAMQSHIDQILPKAVKPGHFNIDEFRLALLKRREEREAGKKPTTALRHHPATKLRGASVENPNGKPVLIVDEEGAFFDPKLKVLVDARTLGTRTADKEQEALVLAAEHKAAEAFLPQLNKLTTEDDEGRLITVKEDEAQQLANGIFTWGHMRTRTRDIRLDCTDTLADAGKEIHTGKHAASTG